VSSWVVIGFALHNFGLEQAKEKDKDKKKKKDKERKKRGRDKEISLRCFEG